MPDFHVIELRCYPSLRTGKQYSILCLKATRGENALTPGVYECDVGEVLR